MKKFLTVILVIFILLPGSVFHDALIVLLICWMWRRELEQRLEKWRYAYTAIWTALIVFTLLMMPRPFALPGDRTQLVHFNSHGERISAPLHHWFANLLMPEETMCAVGCLGALLPTETSMNMSGTHGAVNNSIIGNYRHDVLRGHMFGIGTYYRRAGTAMSGIHTQVFNSLLGEDVRSVQIVKPKNFDKNRDYPVIFFAHGYLGNWKLYRGLLAGIEDHIIVYIGTEDLSGIFNGRHIREIKELYLPMLEDIGYKVVKEAISLMGLSNGGSVIDAAYASNPNDYQNLIYTSTGVNHSGPTRAKVMIIGGGLDHCAPSMRNGMYQLRTKGQNSAFCFNEEDTHLKLISDIDNITDFLNQEL